MIGRIAALNTPEDMVAIMSDIGADGMANAPELAELMREVAKVATEALV